VLFVAVFLAGVLRLAAFAGGAFTAAFLTGAFFRAIRLATGDCAFAAALFAAFFAPFFRPAATFLAATGCALAASARFSAQRFLSAATIAALPALLSFRLGFVVSAAAGAGGSDSPRTFAHRRCWASFILRRAAAENFLRLRGAVPSVAVGSMSAHDG
jgi:hypothetical protein